MSSSQKTATAVLASGREALSRRITRGYLIALAAIALLSLGSHLLLVHLLDTQRGYAPAINLAGRQRMLSQRVSRFALEYSTAPTADDRARSARLLDETLTALTTAHDTLSRGNLRLGIAPPHSAELQAMYDAPPVDLNRRIEAYTRAARDLLAMPESALAARPDALQQVLDAAQSPLLAALDTVTRRYETDSQQQVDQLALLQNGLLAVVLLTLLGEALLIFRPMVAAVRSSHAKIDDARQELESVFDGIPESVFVLDDDLVIRRSNRAAARLWDRDLDALQDQPLTALAEDATRLVRAVVRRAAFHQLHELTAWRDDGSSFPFEYQLAPHTGGTYLLSGRDVTERREREHRLRMYESAFVNSSEPIVIFESLTPGGASDHLAYINPAFTQILGYTPLQVIGQPMDALLMPDPAPDVSERIAKGFSSRVPQVVETPMQRRDGTPLWCELTFMPTPDARGTVNHVVLIIRDISERRERERKVWEQANLDLLTGLPNRRLFNERLRVTLEEAERTRQPAALLFIDLDGFKAVNDRHGHDAGDELLRQVARRLTGTVRGEDLVARLAGDEFTVICPKCPDRTEAARVAQRIIDRLAEPVELASGAVKVGASIGAALYPVDAASPLQLVRAADQAMYRSKAAGRNTVRHAGDEPPPALKSGSDAA